MKKRTEAIIIPVIVARVYFRKLFIFKQFNGMNYKYIKNKMTRLMRTYEFIDFQTIYIGLLINFDIIYKKQNEFVKVYIFNTFDVRLV
jgi:hypothetical protein